MKPKNYFSCLKPVEKNLNRRFFFLDLLQEHFNESLFSRQQGLTIIENTVAFLILD